MDGASDPTVLANKFANVFKSACSNNSAAQSSNLFNEFLTAYDVGWLLQLLALL